MKWNSKEVVFIFVSVLTLAVSAVGFFFGPNQIPLWYSLPVSEQQLDQKAFLFVFPVAVIFIALLHVFFIRLTKKMDATFGRIILWSSLVPLAILVVALIHIVVITI